MKKLRFILAGAIVIIALAVWAKTALLQDADAPLSGKAKEAFEEGLAAAGVKDWPKAIAGFRRALESSPMSSEALFNLALACDKAGGRELVAIPWYRAYLTLAKDPQRIDAVRSRIRQLEEKVVSDSRSILSWSVGLVSEYVGEGLEKDNAQFQSYMQISRAQAEAGDYDGACNTATILPESYAKIMKPRFDSFLDIALKNGDLAAAKVIFDRMTQDESILFGARYLFAAHYFDAGDLTGYNDFVKQAEDLGGKVKDEQMRYAQYISLAKLKAKAKDRESAGKYFSLARDTIPKIKFDGFFNPDDSRALYYILLLQDQLETGDSQGIPKTIELALAQAQRLGGNTDKDRSMVDMYCRLIVVLAKSGNMQEAKKVYALADKQKYWVTDRLRKLDEESMNLGLSVSLDERNKYSGEMINKLSIVGPFAAAEASLGDINAARATIANMYITAPEKDRSFQPNACLGVVKALTEKGDIPDSWEFAAMSNHDYQKITAYKYIALAAAKAGDFSAARKAIGLMAPGSDKDQFTRESMEQHMKIERDEALKELSLAQAAKGDLVSARKTASEINNYNIMFEVYKKAAAMQLKTPSKPDNKAAVEIFSQMAERNSRIPFFTDMAGYLGTVKQRAPEKLTMYQNPTGMVEELSDAVSAMISAVEEGRLMEQCRLKELGSLYRQGR
jgi:hypothetical protein